MKIQLRKKTLIQLTQDNALLPTDLTPQIAGGTGGAQTSASPFWACNDTSGCGAISMGCGPGVTEICTQGCPSHAVACKLPD